MKVRYWVYLIANWVQPPDDFLNKYMKKVSLYWIDPIKQHCCPAVLSKILNTQNCVLHFYRFRFSFTFSEIDNTYFFQPTPRRIKIARVRFGWCSWVPVVHPILKQAATGISIENCWKIWNKLLVRCRAKPPRSAHPPLHCLLVVLPRKLETAAELLGSQARVCCSAHLFISAMVTGRILRKSLIYFRFYCISFSWSICLCKVCWADVCLIPLLSPCYRPGITLRAYFKYFINQNNLQTFHKIPSSSMFDRIMRFEHREIL